MKNLLACLAFCASLSASAQVVYPYNPGANADIAIEAPDLLELLPLFGSYFTPGVALVNGQSL